MTTIPALLADTLAPRPWKIAPRYSVKADKWHWRMTAANGKTVADGAEMYSRESTCEDAIDRLLGATLQRKYARNSQSKQLEKKG